MPESCKNPVIAYTNTVRDSTASASPGQISGQLSERFGVASGYSIPLESFEPSLGVCGHGRAASRGDGEIVNPLFLNPRCS